MRAFRETPRGHVLICQPSCSVSVMRMHPQLSEQKLKVTPFKPTQSRGLMESRSGCLGFQSTFFRIVRPNGVNLCSGRRPRAHYIPDPAEAQTGGTGPGVDVSMKPPGGLNNTDLFVYFHVYVCLSECLKVQMPWEVGRDLRSPRN